MKHTCTVTVIDKKVYPELQEKYLADPESGACPCFEEGQEFVFERAADYRFEDKKKYYRGFESARGYKEGTQIKELCDLAESAEDFNESRIEARTHEIIDAFMDYVAAQGLMS